MKFDPYQSVAVPVPKRGVVVDCFYHPRDLKRRGLVVRLRLDFSFFSIISSHKGNLRERHFFISSQFRMEFSREHTFAYHEPQLQQFLNGLTLDNFRILVTRNGGFHASLHVDVECNRLDENMELHL